MNSYHKLLLLLLFFLGCSHDTNKWEAITLSEAPDFLLASVDFTDSNRGVLLATNRGESRLFYSENLSNQWDMVYETNHHLHDISLTSNGSGIAVGNGGVVYVTNDFGQTWDFIESGVEQPLITVSHCDENGALAAGLNGTIIYSNDRGHSWRHQTAPENIFLRSISCIGNRAVAVGYSGTVFYTDNTGSSWSKNESGITDDLLAVQMVNTKKAIAAGRNGSILVSNDATKTWLSRSSGTSQGFLDLDFYDAKNGIAVGFNGIILKTADGGESWKKLNSNTDHALYAVYLTDNNSGFIVGERGIVLTFNQ